MYYARKAAQPGERFEVEVVLESKTVTPTDFTHVRLVGTERVVVGEGKGSYLSHYDIVRLQAVEPARVLTPGEHRKRYSFDLPANAPASMTGLRCVVHYAFSVHVSVPWWPDRRATFVLPVVPPPSSALGGTPRIVSSSDGPRAGQIYIEASIDRDVIEPGGTITGAVSIVNTATHRIRRTTIALVALETITKPGPYQYEAQRYALTLAEGQPPESDPMPFRLLVPPQIAPSLDASSFKWRWQLEVRAVIAFGTDVVMRVPLSIERAPVGAAVRPPGRYFLVGRDRFARVWQDVAVRLGMTFDPDASTLRARSGEASLALRRVYDGNAYRLQLDFAWPSLGLDMSVTERAWNPIGMLASSWTSEHSTANARFTMRSREHAQLAAILDAKMLGALVDYSGVNVHDAGAQMGVGIAGTSGSSLEGWCRMALALLRRWDELGRQVPAPALMAAALPAWRAFAQTTGGKLEVGSMSLRDATIGVDRFHLETHWRDATAVDHTRVTFMLEPPLERATSIADPALSAAARETWNALAKDRPTLDVSSDRVSWRIDGAVADPQTLTPALELAAQLVRALRGRPQSGPFR